VRLLVMVAVLLALVFGGAGYAYRYARDHADQAIHQVIDTQLPQRVQAHAWAPVAHGRPKPRDAVVFDAGRVDTVRCHVGLGSYRLTVVHGFSFTASTARIRPGCPGALVRRALAKASHAADATDGTATTLTFTGSGRTVLTLRGVPR
jgi:hypothetical protein